MKKILIIISTIFIFCSFGCSVTSVNTTSKRTSNTTSTTSTNTTNTTSRSTTTSTITSTKGDNMTTKTKVTYTGEAIAVGIWHRPNVMSNETNLDGIKSTLNIFKRCGINIVYLETIYHGMAMYKSSYLPYYTTFKNFDYGEYPDYLTAFVSEAKKLNIEVHAWVEDFYIGISKGTLADNHSDWLLLNQNGDYKQTEGNGYIFLDPANKEVTNFLTTVYEELLTKNKDIRGINLDYIRYPVSSKSDDTGFTTYAMTEFLNELNHDVPEGSTLIDTFKKVIKNNYTQWNNYRINKVTTFVKNIKEMMKIVDSSLILSTAIFPNSNDSLTSKKQDYKDWINKGYIDVVTPMAYYDNTSTLEYYLKEMLKDSGDTYSYTGLSCIYHDLSSDIVLSQIRKSIELSNGFVIFGSQKLLNNQTYINLLNNYFKDLDYYLPHLE